MKIYYIISIILFCIIWIGTFIGGLIFGGTAIVPTEWIIITLVILVNCLIAMGIAVYKAFKY